MNENLEQLRQVAERATEGPWAPWMDQDGAEHMNGMLMVGNEAAVIPAGETWVEGVDVNPIACVYTPEDRAHIATFDPTTVLALLDRIKYLKGQAHRNYQDWQTAYARAEAVEAAVQRVRELAENAKASRHESTEFLHPLAILRALDGGEQE